MTIRVSPTLVTINAGTYSYTKTFYENFHDLLLGIIHVNKTTSWFHQTSSGQWTKKPRPNELRNSPGPALPSYILHLIPRFGSIFTKNNPLANKSGYKTESPKQYLGHGEGKACHGRPLEKSPFCQNEKNYRQNPDTEHHKCKALSFYPQSSDSNKVSGFLNNLLVSWRSGLCFLN